MDKLSEHAIRMLEIVNREGVANRDIDAIARAVYDLILQAQMLEMAGRCKTCRHWWKSEEVCLLDDCHYESETEPQKMGSIERPKTGICAKCGRNDCEQKMEHIDNCNGYIEPQTLKGGEDVHEFCKRCDESKARMIDGERYIVCEKASDMTCVSMKKCPLGKWVCEETYVFAPQI